MTCICIWPVLNAPSGELLEHMKSWERTKFDIVHICLRFLLEVMILYHQQMLRVLISNLYSGGWCVPCTQAHVQTHTHTHARARTHARTHLTLGELHVLIYPRWRKTFWVALGFKVFVTCCVFSFSVLATKNWEHQPAVLDTLIFHCL